MYPLLENAPAHESPEFIDYLRANNKVVWEIDYWIVIENCKYHTPEKPWYTAFTKNALCNDFVAAHDLYMLWEEFKDFKWVKKAKAKQTVRRFHIHLIKE